MSPHSQTSSIASLPLAQRCAHATRRYLLPLLVIAYGCSAVYPSAGLWLRAPFSTSSHVSLIHFMLAALLFTLGLSVTWNRIGEVIVECKWVGVAVLVKWLACMVLLALTHFVPPSFVPILLGCIVIMAVPTAASSSGWSMQLGCHQAATVAVIMGTTILAVVSAPAVFAVGAYFGSPASIGVMNLLHDYCDAGFVLPWVLIPTLLGISFSSLFPKAGRAFRKIGHSLSPFLLLLLNYSNGSSSLPQLRDSLPLMQILIVFCACIGLLMIVGTTIYLLANSLGASRSRCMSAVLGSAMSNTGLALVLATLAMPQDVEIHITIIVYTFVQHFAAALLARRREAREEPHEKPSMSKTPARV